MNILPSPRNAIANSSNHFQGDAKKVLCVCSASLLRSQTLAVVLNRELGYNTRGAGAAKDFAITPINEAMIAWADEIVIVEEGVLDYFDKEDRQLLRDWDSNIVILDIPDRYNYMDENLQKICVDQYLNSEAKKIGEIV